MEGPASSYSCLLIHISWKVESEAQMESPIQTEYLHSGGAIIQNKQKSHMYTTHNIEQNKKKWP